MVGLLFFLLRLLVSPFRPISRLEVENAALRRQLIVLQRQVRGRVQFTNSDRLFFLQLYRWFPSIVEAMTIRDAEAGPMALRVTQDIMRTTHWQQHSVRGFFAWPRQIEAGRQNDCRLWGLRERWDTAFRRRAPPHLPRHLNAWHSVQASCSQSRRLSQAGFRCNAGLCTSRHASPAPMAMVARGLAAALARGFRLRRG